MFTITVTNNGTYDATNIKVKDVLPTNLKLCISYWNGTGSYSADIWTIRQ
ncbi:MAG: DUF11 domain-containing protein [Anaerolineales bacterium]|nr:DUF11 domain-containing protein [Anaerolineales bacterium]